jgi:hypothetical protein
LHITKIKEVGIMRKSYIVSFILIMSFFLLGMGEERALKVKDFSSEKRVALVIGNSNYKYNPLKNPGNDAEDIAKELKNFGFEVILKKNINRREMAGAIKEFGKKIRNGGVGLFYFAGHGVQIKGENYLIPLNEHIETEEDVEFEAIQAGRILAEMERAGNKMNIIILDACRNNPFESSSRNSLRGLARMDAPTGSLLVYSTSPGKTALDGENARNGVFTESLLTELKTNPSVNINDLLINVRTRVISKTDSAQTPWESSSLTGKFYFARSTVDEYESFRNDQTKGLKEFEIKESNLKDVIKKRAVYRSKMNEEFAGIVAMESDEYITPEEKIILWEDYLDSFPDDNPHRDEVNDKIIFWKNFDEEEEHHEEEFVEALFFEDHFEDNRNDWFEVENDEQRVEVEGDGYFIYNKNYLQKVWRNDMVEPNSDFIIETSISKLGGYNNNGLNILFGAENSGDKYYIFGTTGTGYYGAFRYDNGWHDVLPWKKSNFINTDDATNDLRIEKKDNTLYFYINGDYVNKINDFESFGPAIGFAINPDIEAKVRSLVIRRELTEVLFEENFSNNQNYWPVENSSGKKLIVDDGYTIYNKDFFQKSWINNITKDHDNLEIEVELQRLSGKENNAMNVLFGLDPSGEKYLTFGISGDGQYLVSSYTGTWKNLIDWTPSSHIRTGTGVNTIKVVKEGNVFFFYINDNYVNEIESSEWYGTSIGFGVNAGIETKIKRVLVTSRVLDAVDDSILIEDEFEDNHNNWYEIEGDGLLLKVRNGEYEMYSRDQYYKTWQNSLFENEEQNFEIESEMRRDSGIENNIYGILFGMDSSGSNFYHFGVSANGYYAVFKYDGSWVNEIAWTKSSFINNGKEPNHLRLRRVNNEVLFYINDNYIGKITNYDSFGLAVGVGVASDMNIRIENYKVRLIDE